MARLPRRADGLEQAKIEQSSCPRLYGCDNTWQVPLAEVRDIRGIPFRFAFTVVPQEPVEMPAERVERRGRPQAADLLEIVEHSLDADDTEFDLGG